MNCLEVRRALLAEPRRRTSEVEAHLAACARCGAVAAGLLELDDRIAEAASIPAPDALADRILLARERRPRLRYAAAAAVLITAALGVIVGTDLVDTAGVSRHG